MNDDLISRKAVIEENVDKVRVSSAEIVVHGTKENPYYEIEYFDLSDNEIHIGFSSYKLDVVFGYLEKYFDIVNEENKSTEALVYQTPTTVILICPYCDHENDYEYDDFRSDNGAPPDWDYTKIECKECHRIFQIQGRDWL